MWYLSVGSSRGQRGTTFFGLRKILMWYLSVGSSGGQRGTTFFRTSKNFDVVPLCRQQSRTERYHFFSDLEKFRCGTSLSKNVSLQDSGGKTLWAIWPRLDFGAVLSLYFLKNGFIVAPLENIVMCNKLCRGIRYTLDV